MTQPETHAAGIDIGTNTILMVIGSRDSTGKLRIVTDQHAVARLGADVDKTGRISTAAVQRASEILQRYKELCGQHAVKHVYAVTTSAMRDATNSTEVRRQLEKVLSYPINIIDGEHEARLSFIGACPGGQSSIVDIGGGSTELVTGNDSGPQHAKSLDIGAVRLSERHFTQLPPFIEEVHAARKSIRKHLQCVNWSNFGTLVGVGGTPTSLAAMALDLDQMRPEQLDGVTISATQITELCEHLLAQNLDQIRSHPAIHPHRADILPMGTLILDEIMQYCDASFLQISIRGLRYGALSAAFSENSRL